MSDTADLPQTRADAIKAGAIRYFTGKPCRSQGHVAARYTINGSCAECLRLSNGASKDAVKLGRLQAALQREANALGA